MNQDKCPDCGRRKAQGLGDVLSGRCPKWYIDKPDAHENCKTHLENRRDKAKRFYSQILKANVCVCREKKIRKQAFCVLCLKALTLEMRKDVLQKPIGGGFEQAYLRAYKALMDIGRVKEYRREEDGE